MGILRIKNIKLLKGGFLSLFIAILAITTLILVSSWRKKPADELFKLGTEAYQEENYKKAVRYFELCQEKLEKQEIKDVDRNDLFHYLADCYSELGNYDKAVDFGTQMVIIRRETLGEKHPDYAESLSNLASYYHDSEDVSKAIELESQALEVRREVLGEKHPDFAWSLDNLSCYYFYKDDYAKAIELVDQAHKIFRDEFGEKHPLYIKSLEQLACCHSCQGDYAKAVDIRKQIAKIQKETVGDKHPDYAESLWNLALCYSDLKDYAKAIELMKQSMSIIKKTLGKKHPDYVGYLECLASYYYDIGNYTKAIEFENKALKITGEIDGDNHPNYATCLNSLSIFYSCLGNYSKAVELGEHALKIRKETLGEFDPNYARSLQNLADCYHILGDDVKAVGFLNQALKIIEIQKEKIPYHVHILLDFANSYSDIGDNAKAIELGNQAVEINGETLGENHPDYAESLHRLAGFYYNYGDYAKALEFESHAVEIIKETHGDNHLDYAESLNHLAVYYWKLHDNKRSIELGNQALEFNKMEYGEKSPEYAMSLHNLASYYSCIGDVEKAIELLSQALKIIKETLGEINPDYAASLHNLANRYSDLDNYAKAIELGNRALEIRKKTIGKKHPEYARSLENLARYYSGLGNYTKAIELGNQALKIQKETIGEKHPDYAKSLADLADCYGELGEYTKAADYYQKNITICYFNILNQFGGLTRNQRELFWQHYSHSFTDWYPFYAYKSFSQVADVYDKSALFAKGLLLTTEIEMNKLIQESGDEEALTMFEELRQKRLMLQKLYEKPIDERVLNTDSLEQETDKLESELVKRSQVYGDFSRKLRTTWKDVQTALDEDEMAVEFLSFGNKLLGDSTMVVALTLRKDDKEPKLIPLFEQKQLEHVKDNKTFYSQEVTNLVWKPLEKELKGIKRIYFSAAGILHKVGIEYAPGMEVYDMYRLSTTREVIDMKEKGEKNLNAQSDAVLYGGINYEALAKKSKAQKAETGKSQKNEDDTHRSISINLHHAFIDSLKVRGTTLDYLPGTLDEVRNISNCFEQKNRKVITGTDATETSVKNLPNRVPKILHIATHGFYYTESEEKINKARRNMLLTDENDKARHHEDAALSRSGLFMAGASKSLKGEEIPLGEDDGILTAQEIAKIDLRGVDLVVLSACETGRGDINQGEGVYGLQRGFKKAGVQTILMSLWKVSDKATEILMTEFYKQACAGLSKRTALQIAQKKVREYKNSEGKLLFEDPFFWAGFILLD